jgi:hypothetical protein
MACSTKQLTKMSGIAVAPHLRGRAETNATETAKIFDNARRLSVRHGTRR